MGWLQGELNKGRELFLSMSYNPDTKKEKLKITLGKACSSSMRPVASNVIAALPGLFEGLVVTDKGHTNSAGRTVAEFWLYDSTQRSSQLPRQRGQPAQVPATGDSSTRRRADGTSEAEGTSEQRKKQRTSQDCESMSRPSSSAAGEGSRGTIIHLVGEWEAMTEADEFSYKLRERAKLAEWFGALPGGPLTSPIARDRFDTTCSQLQEWIYGLFEKRFIAAQGDAPSGIRSTAQLRSLGLTQGGIYSMVAQRLKRGARDPSAYSKALLEEITAAESLFMKAARGHIT